MRSSMNSYIYIENLSIDRLTILRNVYQVENLLILMKLTPADFINIIHNQITNNMKQVKFRRHLEVFHTQETSAMACMNHIFINSLGDSLNCAFFLYLLRNLLLFEEYFTCSATVNVHFNLSLCIKYSETKSHF